jgi:hypothetical protein
VLCIHSFNHQLLVSLSLFSFPLTFLAFSLVDHHVIHSFSPLLHLTGAYCFQTGCIIRLGDSDAATPRRALASLRCDTLSSWYRAYPLLGPRLLQAGLLRHTHLLHTPIHSYIHSHITPTTTTTAVARNRDTPASRGSAHSPSRANIRTDKSLGIGLQRTKKRTVSNTARHNTTTTQHITP